MQVKIENISKIYGKGEVAVQALKEVTYSFQSPRFLAVCGPSGSGKSTLLTILAGLHHPTSGQIIVDGISLYEELDSDGLARFRQEYVGFVFQSFYLIPYLNALENVMIPLAPKSLSTKEKELLAKKALEKVGLTSRATHLPSELSGGQRQRVALARALVNNPPLIFADEPTGNLDSATRDEILNLFSEIHSLGHSVIMVTHDPQNVRFAEDVLYLEDGCLLSSKKTVLNQQPRLVELN